MMGLSEKWDRIYSQEEVGRQNPSGVLGDNAFLLPDEGTALDLASGLGANAIFLARHGLQTTALDISSIAIEKLRIYASANKLSIDAQALDVATTQLAPSSFDVIVVSRFLDRSLTEAIVNALKPGGLLFYQTFTRLKLFDDHGPNNPAYLLAEQELLQLFAALCTVYYRDNGALGDIRTGLRNEAQYIGQKISPESTS